MKKILLLLALSFVLFFSSCNNGTTPEDLKVDIISAGWTYKNFSADYQNLIWGTSYGSAFFSFTLWYEGEAILPGELVSYTAQCDGLTFNVPLDKDIFLDSSSDPNKHGFDGWFVWRATDTSHFMPLGPWTFTLTFSDDTVTTYTRTFNQPGTTTEVDNSYFITEDYAGGEDSSHFMMVQRADITSVNYSAGDLTVNFNVDDPLVRTGWIRVYDSVGNSLAYSERFVDNENTSSSKLSATFDTTLGTNTFTVNLANELSSSITASGDYSVVVLLTDGLHYNGTAMQGVYDGISYSAPISFSIP